MQNDRNPLNVDLTFLDEKGSPTAEKRSHSSYKINWKTIAVIGGIAIVLGAIIVSNSDSPSTPTTNTPLASVPSYQQPAASSAGNVNVGRYSCSDYDGRRADQLAPVDSSSGIDADQRSLEERAEALTILKTEIKHSGVNQYSSQVAIDRYNRLIDQYNHQLGSYKRDASSFQIRFDEFNAQVEAYNGYLAAHCVKGGG
jgi:hypothetical protein